MTLIERIVRRPFVRGSSRWRPVTIYTNVIDEIDTSAERILRNFIPPGTERPILRPADGRLAAANEYRTLHQPQMRRQQIGDRLGGNEIRCVEPETGDVAILADQVGRFRYGHSRARSQNVRNRRSSPWHARDTHVGSAGCISRLRERRHRFPCSSDDVERNFGGDLQASLAGELLMPGCLSRRPGEHPWLR